MLELNKDRLLSDLSYIINALSREHHKDFIYNNYDNYLNLKELLNDNFGISFEHDKYISIKQFEKIIQKRDIQAFYNFLISIDKSLDIIYELSSNYYNIIKKYDYKTYPFFDCMRKYSEIDFKNLILGYIASLSDELYKIAKRYFDEERIHFDSQMEPEWISGQFAELPGLDSGFIFSRFVQYNSLSANNIVHEFGHAFDSEMFLYPQKKVLPWFSDYLIEVPSMTFETSFNYYLIDNHIDIEGARLIEYSSLSDLGDDAECLKCVCEEIMDADNTLDILPDGYIITPDGNEYDFRNSLVYGLGAFFAFHLDLIRQNSNKEFLKALNNIITTRKEASLEQSIEMTGFSINDFVSCKYLEPIIEKNMLELKKRYKY